MTNSKRPRRAVGELVRRGDFSRRTVWHLYDEKDPEAWWTPIVCGGGISLPGHYETVPECDVCPECVEAWRNRA